MLLPRLLAADILDERRLLREKKSCYRQNTPFSEMTVFLLSAGCHLWVDGWWGEGGGVMGAAVMVAAVMVLQRITLKGSQRG